MFKCYWSPSMTSQYNSIDGSRTGLTSTERTRASKLHLLWYTRYVRHTLGLCLYHKGKTRSKSIKQHVTPEKNFWRLPTEKPRILTSIKLVRSLFLFLLTLFFVLREWFRADCPLSNRLWSSLSADEIQRPWMVGKGISIAKELLHL